MYFYILVKKLINFLLYSNIWIAIGSVALCLESWFLHEQDLNLWYLCFLFCGTNVIYNAHRIIGLKVFIKNQNSSRFKKVMLYQKPIIVLVTVCSVIGIYSFIQIIELLSFCFLIAILASAFYVIPFYKFTRLRDFPFIKIFLIAICWTILCYAIPIEDPDYLLLIERLLFMIAITIPFDIRDQETDKVSNTRTLVSWLGAEVAKKLAVFLSLAACILLILFINNYSKLVIFYLLFYCLTCILVYKSSTNKADHYFSGYLDGLIILRVSFFLVLLL